MNFSSWNPAHTTPRSHLHGPPTGVVSARLLTSVNFAADHRRTPVTGVLTHPLLMPDGKEVLFPEGAKMTGLVTVARPARRFARNGHLRFTFDNIESSEAGFSVIHGQLAAAEASPGAHVELSGEGTAKSSLDPVSTSRHWHCGSWPFRPKMEAPRRPRPPGVDSMRAATLRG
ncbi:MAG TPA: hypothetical protein VGI45_31815 [Terracidiphilus sp.]